MLTAIIHRVRAGAAALPLVCAYDSLECVWSPPMPFLFQRPHAAEFRALSSGYIRDCINHVVAQGGLSGPDGVPLRYTPHDFRRLFVTDGEEYRDVTATEWDEFLAHFELRKVALGTCGRDHGSPCQHENSCVRCPLFRVDPAQLPRLEEIHANLTDRLGEARENGWLGEVAAIETTMAAAAQKLEAMRTARETPVRLGMPTVGHSTGRSNTRETRR